MPDGDDLASLGAALEAATRDAGAYAHSKFRATFRSWTKGENQSPVSEVDVAVDEMLRKSLAAIEPSAAWLSEESIDDPVRLKARRVWIVDPIDGTRAFIAGKEDWSVSVALVEDGRPLAAALFAPSEGRMFLALAGRGATLNGASIAPRDAATLQGARVSGPKFYVDTLTAADASIEAMPRVHSLALRLARVADGTLDIAFAGGNSHDWDLAAADLIVHESGGVLTAVSGEALRYNRPDPVHAILIASGRQRHAALLPLVRERLAAIGKV